jgi:hypothetical protein
MAVVFVWTCVRVLVSCFVLTPFPSFFFEPYIFWQALTSLRRYHLEGLEQVCEAFLSEAYSELTDQSGSFTKMIGDSKRGGARTSGPSSSCFSFCGSSSKVAPF